MSSGSPIIVVGGGLGGLTAALALARRGFAVRVLEGAPEFGAIGYGIQFGPNVFHVFEPLGIADAVLAHADSPPGVIMVDAFDGREVTRVATGRPLFRERFKYPYIVMHRVDLHRILLDACARSALIDLAPDAMVAGFADDGDRVIVRTDDDRSFTGAALIGADGVRSRIRAQMFGDGELRPIGYVSHRTIVPMAELTANLERQNADRNNVVLWAGPGFHIVHYPLRHGELFNIVAVFRTASYAERTDAERWRADLQHTYRDAHPTMKALLAMLDLQRRWALGVRDPVRVWHKGRTVLLGDAAHPTLQTLAQGACMAIEDGFCLAECLHGAGGDFAEAFRQFERARCVRTARVTLESNAIWEMYHAEGVARDVYWQTLGERSEMTFISAWPGSMTASVCRRTPLPEDAAPPSAHEDR
jgi:2-polyprenyl-6-methoxyphenol hydroxylase-like FAD-dependent oxidoreductase